MPPTYVIAELGIAHEGDRDTWRRLIDVAVEAGADAIKGQYWSDSLKMATHRGRGGDAAWFEHYRMPAEWLHDIPTSVEAMCTVYLREDVMKIAPLTHRRKVGSWESSRSDDLLLDWFWHDESAPIVVSTGGWSHAQLNGRRPHKRFEYLHCIPQYPTLAKEMALSMIHRYGLHGFSDHTGWWETGARAVLAGAQIIEAHVMLNCTPETNPDYAVSLVPAAFDMYVQRIREAETWM